MCFIYTELFIAVQFNAIQHNSPAIYPTFVKLIMYFFDSVKVVFSAVIVFEAMVSGGAVLHY